MLLTLLAVAAGVLIGNGRADGYLLAGVAASGLGLLVAHVQHDHTHGEVGLTFDRPMSGDDLWTAVTEQDENYLASCTIYIANPGFRPAKGIFLARLNGQRALVIEGADMENPDGEVR